MGRYSKHVRKRHSRGEFSNMLMNRRGVTIHCLIKQDTNHVEKTGEKLPMGVGDAQRKPQRRDTNMNQIERLLDAINNLSPRIPITVDLWSVREIAAYLKRSEAVVRERITALPGFPQAIRLPVAGSRGRGQPLWKAKEVIAWAEKHQENRIA